MNYAVCDTSSLIRLTKSQVAFCLTKIFDKILIPTAVKNECCDEYTLKTISDLNIETYSAIKLLPIGMGLGERECISLAIELNIETFITDDEKAFRCAIAYGLKPLRTTDILLIAKSFKIIDSVTTILGEMRKRGECISYEVFQSVLTEAGEK